MSALSSERNELCHTCFFSAYTIADDFDEEYLLKEKDGALQESHCNWGGGKPFRTCPRRAEVEAVGADGDVGPDGGAAGLHAQERGTGPVFLSVASARNVKLGRAEACSLWYTHGVE